MNGNSDKPLIIISGPHGSGKDSIANCLTKLESPRFYRIPRYTTRKKADREMNGHDYFFVENIFFDNLIKQDKFLEYRIYPDGSSGTTKESILFPEKSGYGCLTINGEDGLKLKHILDNRGLFCILFFIGPCSKDTFTNNEREYREELRQRLSKRNRPTDDIDERLKKAIYYRNLFLENNKDFNYIENINSQQNIAVEQILSLISNLAVNDHTFSTQ